MKNANVRVLVIVLALVAVTAAAAAIVSLMPKAPSAVTMSEGVTVSPSIPEKSADTLAYLRVQVGDSVWPLIPLTDGGEYTVTQEESGAVNTIRTTKDGAVMHFSTCDNQNCVNQREVTLGNRATRVMGSLIVCLPNQVVLELLDAGEVQ